jgi:hypothetical protein
MTVELDPLGIGSVNISMGGTGANTAGQALSNLGGQPADSDLTIISSGTFAQKRALIEASAKPVYGVANLRLTSADFSGDNRYLTYHTTFNDGGNGPFVWDSASEVADNNGTVIQITGVAVGRWIRQYSGLVNVKWFGAIGNGIAIDTTAIAAARCVGPVILPPGSYLVENLTLDEGFEFMDGSVLTPLGTPTITVNGQISAGRYKIFETGFTFTQTGSFTKEYANVEWFGAMSDPTLVFDSGPGINECITFANNTITGTIDAGAGSFLTKEPLVFTKSVGMRGRGINDTTIFGSTDITYGTAIIDYQCTELIRAENVEIKGFTVRDEGSQRLIGIKGVWLTQSEINRIGYYRLLKGYYAPDRSWSVNHINTVAAYCTTAAELGVASGHNNFNGCILSGLVDGLVINVTTGEEIDTINLFGCDIEGTSGNPIKFQGLGSLRNLNLFGVRFEKCIGPISVIGTSTQGFNMKGCDVQNTDGTSAVALSLRNITGGEVSSNHFNNYTTQILDFGAGSNVNVRVENNNYTSSPSFTGFTPDTIYDSMGCLGINNTTGPQEWFGTAAPVSGTFSIGSRVRKSSPTVGQPKGWVCTVSGSPGTWVSEGNL